MNAQKWYLYKNDQPLIGPTHYMAAVSKMNGLTVIGFPGSAAFQRDKIYKVGADTYELSTDTPAEKLKASVGPVLGQAVAKYPHLSEKSAQLKEVVTIVGVKFVSESNVIQKGSQIYHFKTNLSFKPGDFAVVESSGQHYKIVQIEYIRADGTITANAWIVDKIDLTAHMARKHDEKTEAEKASRAAAIRARLDAKLAAKQEIQKYDTLGDQESAQLVAELRRLSQ